MFANSKASVEIFQWAGSRFNSVQLLATSNVLSAKPYTVLSNGNTFY